MEADWPDATRVDAYVRGRSGDASAEEALGDFRRFPAWMWRNREVAEFVEWLRDHNDEQKPHERAGFYGLDLYSLHASIQKVVDYLEDVDPEAAARARTRYACFEDVGDPQEYARAAHVGATEPCEGDVVAQLLEFRERAAELALTDGRIAEDLFFFAEQNARVVRNAERYYRSLFRGRESSWNLRDRHMAETLEALADHLSRERENARVIVWAHNSHLGDARATEMGRRGELNLGQLVRERHLHGAFIVGFTTYEGTVTAAGTWGGEAERKRVRPALPESYEDVLHEAMPPAALLFPREVAELARRRLQRAIGVIYRPETERLSHYFEARIREQFDALIHLDETSAVEPLETTSIWERGELPETFPSAL